jgi:hypothetical protein
MSDAMGASRLPEIRMLGPVTVIADGPVCPSHRRRLTELGVFLAVTPRATAARVQDALWPGPHPSATTRYAALSRLRGWWGVDETGAPYVERHTYRVRAWTDWDQMRALTGYDGGVVDLTGIPTTDLIAALMLVRGRPFAGVAWRRYQWADALRVDIDYLIDQTAVTVIARTGPTTPAGRRAAQIRASTVTWLAS